MSIAIAIVGSVAGLWLVLAVFFFTASGDLIEAALDSLKATIALTAVVAGFLGFLALWGWAL